jgi:hypothetical protein
MKRECGCLPEAVSSNLRKRCLSSDIHFWLSKQEPQRLEAEQQAARHLVGSRCANHVLVHRQDVAKAAIERALLIGRCTACRLIDELHRLDAHADGVGI